jgi:teichuronic acid biosynthesis glycosyltransferase TuaC
LRVLFISNLFPDTREPARGTVNSRLLHHLAAHCEIRVFSPRPVLPVISSIRGDTRRVSTADDALFEPQYPPTYYVPKVGSRFNHRIMTSVLEPGIRKLAQRFPFDVILGAWIYPDGCAVARLAAQFNVPFVLIAQGSDVHEYMMMPTRRRIIVEHVQRATAIITRSRELARLLEEAQIDSSRLRIIYNGVDFDRFEPATKAQARQELGLEPGEKIVLYVGGFF